MELLVRISSIQNIDIYFLILVGHAVGQQLFSDLSNDLKDIMKSIDDHGDLIANKLSDNQATDSLEKEIEEETNNNILSALQVDEDNHDT